MDVVCKHCGFEDEIEAPKNRNKNSIVYKCEICKKKTKHDIYWNPSAVSEWK